MNLSLIRKQPGEETCYKSIDTVPNEEATNYPTEFLNSLAVPGLPQHKIILKKRATIMLLRNMNPPKLCNGTRLTVKRLEAHVIEATIMTGKFKGHNEFIPKIPLMSIDMGIEFRRVQFPAIHTNFAIHCTENTNVDLTEQ